MTIRTAHPMPSCVHLPGPVALLAFALLAFAPLTGNPARAGEPLGDPDRMAIRTTVERHLDALARDDIEAAFALASSRLRARAGNARAFVEMVHGSYSAVVRPRVVFFQDITMVGSMPAQRVMLLDSRGRPWTAVFPMQREADGDWRVDGCMLYEGSSGVL